MNGNWRLSSLLLALKEQNAMFFDAASSVRPLPNMDELKAFDIYYAWRRAEAKGKGGVSK